MGHWKLWFTLGAAGALLACGKEDPPDAIGTTHKEVVDQYAEIVSRNYQAALAKTEALDDAVQAFVGDRTQAKLEAARTAWLAARTPYGQTEAFRFSDGPIDNPTDGPEGRINPWPLDEAYIDVVAGSTTARNIINDTTVALDEDTLAGLNEGGQGDVFETGASFDAGASISLGYHAIEFMLWGQDNNDNGPGNRPATDFLATGGTLPNGERRARYLSVVSTILVKDLKRVADQWTTGAAYRTTFVSTPTESLKKLTASIGILAKGELGSERMDVALNTKDQEDEHSCFSDNTHVDFRMNQLGIQNVYLGKYDTADGPGIQDLLRDADPAKEAVLTAHMADLVARLDAFQPPVDRAISDDTSAGYMQLSAVVQKLFEEGDLVADAAQAIGLGTISVELPE
jgi:putative iron-regulated protein